MKGQGKVVGAGQTVCLELSPRTAKLMVASSCPFRIERVNASTLPEHSDDTLSALRALLDANPVGSRPVGLLFGREIFSLQTLELPSSDPKEIASMLELQLGKLTPYPRTEILFGSTAVGSFREGYTTVLLAISRKSLIEGVLQYCKTKGLMPQWVGVSTEGLEAWWTAAGKASAPMSSGQLTAIIDVDFASTDCAILSADDRLLFTHSISIGSEQLATSEPAKLRWVGELIRLPRILSHEEVKGQIGRGILTGVTEGLTPVVEQLSSQWGAPVELRDALQGVSAAAVQSQARATRVSYTALAGSAQAARAPRLDIIPQEAKVSQALRVRSRHLTRLVVNLATILLLAVLLYAERIAVLGQYLRELETALLPLEQTSTRVREQQQQMREIRGWLEPSRSALAAVQAVAAAVDPAITITQLTFKEGEPVKIKGVAATSQAPYAFVERLKQQRMLAVGASCVAEVRVTSTRGAEFDVACPLKES